MREAIAPGRMTTRDGAISAARPVFIEREMNDIALLSILRELFNKPLSSYRVPAEPGFNSRSAVFIQL